MQLERAADWREGWRIGALTLLISALGCANAGPVQPPAPSGRAPTDRPVPSANRIRVPASVGPPTEAPTASAALAAASARSAPLLASGCPDDMQAISGSFCTRLERKCLRRRKRRQCAEYASASSCVGSETAMNFCMDRYEWPNEKGSLPSIMNSFNDAKRSCQQIGKRLCTEDEWTLACEGPERLGFPYGNVRDSSACPFDKPSPHVNEARLYFRHTQQAELARLDQRDPSGSYSGCVSAYGVHDMTGSVDEWVLYPPGKPYRSSLKGGNWGEYRNACRPVTRGHGEGWRYYQTGFRCCKARDEPSAQPAE